MEPRFFGPILLLGFLPLVAYEIWWYRKQTRSYDWKGTASSLGVYAGTVVTKVLFAGTLFGVFLLAREHRLLEISMTSWWHWAALFFSVEFTYYWFHRLSHESRWLWATHSVHHSPNELNLVAALRLGWTGTLSGSPLFFVPLVWIGFAPSHVFGMLTVNLLYQFWLHTEMVPKLPRMFEWFFNTPSHHRAHHASNPEYLDTNYGGIVIVFDRIFGSFAEEREDVPKRYGLVHPMESRNPFVIALREWGWMYRDVKQAKNLREVAGYMFGPPGWSPDGSRFTTAAIKASIEISEDPALDYELPIRVRRG